MIGAATFWCADAIGARRGWKTPLGAAACALLAIAPDVDWLFNAHRTHTHSIGAVALVVVAASIIAGRADRRAAALLAGCAYATHLALDSLSVDSSVPAGFLALWPLSNEYYFASRHELFLSPSLDYHNPRKFISMNVRYLVRELTVLTPVAALVWLVWCRQRILREPAAVTPAKIAGLRADDAPESRG